MEPLLSLTLRDSIRIFHPGEQLEGQYQIDAVSPSELCAAELSVLWFTEGKGDEDMAVHFFQRRVPADADQQDLRPAHTFRTSLPNSPLSYSGVSLKIRWCVRLRVFLLRGREASLQLPFQLGAASPANAILDPRSAPHSSGTPRANILPKTPQQTQAGGPT